MTQYLLGIDSGGTMTKAALFTLDGREVAASFSLVPMLFPEPGHTERNPDRMWDATCEAIGKVIESAGIASDTIAAVCATGYGSGLYCIDDEGAPTCNGIVSTDSRGLGVMADWAAAGFEAAARDTLAQSFWPAQSLTLFGWFQKHRPEVCRRTTTILECKDFIKLRLTGRSSTDVTDAAIGGLLDMRAGTYAETLMATLGLDDWIPKLPELLQPHDVAGEVTPRAAKQTGLRAGTPVVSGAVDIVCSAVASGVVDTSRLSIVAGTWSINNAVRKGSPQYKPEPFLQMPYLNTDLFLACEASATSASNLEWCCKHVFDGEKMPAETAGQSIYERCGQLVESRRDTPPPVVFLPYLYGGPGGEPAGFVGAQAHHEKADLVHAVYEGIVFAHKRHVDQLLAASNGPAPEAIRLAGGAARSDIWAQMFADILALPVEVAAGSEFGAAGACICAAVGTGIHENYQHAVEQMVRVSKRFEPDNTRTDQALERYARFVRIGDSLAASW